jgi:predicted DNA-binding transcriptional regulator AlpA
VPQPKKVITWPRLQAEKGIPWSRQRVWQLEAEGKFPRRFWLGDNTIAWWEHEIDAWLDERATAVGRPDQEHSRAIARARAGHSARQRKRKPEPEPAEAA